MEAVDGSGFKSCNLSFCADAPGQTGGTEDPSYLPETGRVVRNPRGEHLPPSYHHCHARVQLK